LVEAYAKEQGMWRADDTPDPIFSSTLSLNMGDVVSSISGPKRPQDRVALAGADVAFAAAAKEIKSGDIGTKGSEKRYDVEGANYKIDDGDVVIAAITSCTNTSNPSVMIGAGLLARNARAKGLSVKPWVKTSLAPGSQIVTDYLEKANLQDDLDAMGFNLVGYGCTTCIGNSGPLPEPISNAINNNDVLATSVLSGNRNFEGRVSPDCRANYLASPPLVVAYAIAGSMHIDITKEALGQDQDGNDVFLKDIWPSTKEIADLIRTSINEDMFHTRYGNAFKGDAGWQEIEVSGGETYDWSENSTYVQNPPYFEGMTMEPEAIEDIKDARILGLFADSITTDHISPAGSFKAETPAGGYLTDRQVRPIDFNSYGSRRGNHEIMMRGTFANIRIKNQMLSDVEGGFSKHYPSGEQGAMYDVAMRYKEEGTPLVIFAGKEYGTGSSRDWAAKGTRLLGVKAVVTESFERIHRSNLIGMGVLPLVFTNGDTWEGLGMKGDEQVSIAGLTDLKPRQMLTADITFSDGSKKSIELLVRVDTEDELDYYKAGGILHYVLRNLNRAA